MDVALTIVLALLTGTVGSVIGSVITIIWTGRQQDKRDAAVYGRAVQDGSRERLRLVYVDFLHAIRGVHDQARGLSRLAYGRMDRAAQEQMQERTMYWNKRRDHIQRQALLAHTEGSTLDLRKLMRPWVAECDAFVAVINATAHKRRRYFGLASYVPADYSSWLAAEDRLRRMDAEYLVLDKALCEHLANMTALDGGASESKPLPTPTTAPELLASGAMP